MERHKIISFLKGLASSVTSGQKLCTEVIYIVLETSTGDFCWDTYILKIISKEISSNNANY